LYCNHVPVGEGIRKSGVPREDIFVTSKVAFFPENSKGNVFLYDKSNGKNNEKGGEEASIDTVLKELGVDYVDLLLIHNPVSSDLEFKAAFSVHFFELFNLKGYPQAIRPTVLADGDLLRPIVLNGLLEQAKKGPSKEYCLDIRKRSWAALEKALKDGKAKAIGVSNYPLALLKEMEEYAEIMPAVN
jgi:diketogulonate reductase-like aldo/keto reductase